jgi:hypothetical protein
MIDELREIGRPNDEVTRIVESDADWEIKYTVIFSMAIGRRIRDLKFDFDWCDPDGSYEDDVRAYLDALLTFKRRCGDLLDRDGDD